MSGDPNFSSVVLLVGFDGTNGSTSITDESNSAHTFTAHGNAKITTTSPPFGTGCGTFDGAADWFQTPGGADFQFGSGDFTIETTIRLASKTDNQAICGVWDTNSWFLWIFSGQLNFRAAVTSGGSFDVVHTWAPTLGTTYHIAVDRSGTTLRLYIDGAMVAKNSTYSYTFVSGGTAAFTIGTIGTADSFASLDFNGQMDEVRITKGVARYASDSGYTVQTDKFPRTGSSVGTTFNVSGSASLASSCHMLRGVATYRSAGLASSSSASRGVTLKRSGAASTAASLQKGAGKSLSASLSTASAMARSIGKQGVVAISTAASAARGIGKTLSASVASSSSVLVGSLTTLVLSASVSASASLVRTIGKTASASLATSATASRSIGIVRMAAVHSGASIVKATARSLSASVIAAASIGKAIAKSLSASLASTASALATFVQGVTPSLVVAAIKIYAAVSGALTGYAAVSGKPTNNDGIDQ